MKFKINNIEWEIEEVDPNNSMLLVDNGRCKGATHFYHQKIFLDETIKEDSKKCVLMHELAHAYLIETQVEDKENYTEENLCEFVGIYAGQIVDIASKYFEERVKDE